MEFHRDWEYRKTRIQVVQDIRICGTNFLQSIVLNSLNSLNSLTSQSPCLP